MQILKEMHGARLAEVSSSNSIYADAKSGDGALSIEGASLVFDLGTLVIENRFSVRSHGSEATLSSLVGRSVEGVEEREQEIEILFDGGAIIVISLKEADWRSPEAASYSPKNGPIIVIN